MNLHRYHGAAVSLLSRVAAKDSFAPTALMAKMPHNHGLSAVARIFRRFAAPIGCASREIVLDSFGL